MHRDRYRTLFLGLLLGLLGSSAAGSGTTRATTTTATAARRDGGELLGTGVDQLRYCQHIVPWGRRDRFMSHLVDVLAVELRQECLQAVVIGLDTDGRENVLDVGSRRGGVSTEGEEEVGCEMLHLDGDLVSAVMLAIPHCQV